MQRPMCANESLGCGRDTCPLRSAAVADLTLQVALILFGLLGKASQETLPVALIGLLAQYYWGRHHKNKTLPVPVALIPWKGRRPAVGEDPIKKHFKKTAVSSLGTTSKIMKA